MNQPSPAITQLLPTCQRCRRLRRKCDTQLPNCRVCHKASAECTFYDHTLKQSLPRAYVQSLLTRVEHLQAVKNSTSNSPVQENRARVSSLQSSPESRPSLANAAILPSSPSFDIVIPSTLTAGRRLYWGASSVFSLTVEILQHASSKGLFSVDDSAADASPQHDDHDPHTAQPTRMHTEAPDADVRALVDLYLVSLDKLYGFVDRDETTLDLEIYLALRQQQGFSPQALQGEQAHRYFRIAMMCAISCANQARYRPERSAESLMYFAGASTCVEKVTSEASPASLQALLLLVVFCLFYPRKGDIWKLLDHACRLTIELGYHTEDHVHIEAESDNRMRLRRSTFWGLYAIERIVGQLFGRGSDLPETIITTEYPSALHPGIASGISPVNGAQLDQGDVQSMSIAHHYRLVYLRSEIFRSLYLPASPPDRGLEWFKEQYLTLHQWRQELSVSDDMAGVATLTCDVGFDATICFLFQTLILKALRTTSTPETSEADMNQETALDDILVASDPFYSSVNLIRTYEKIVRAPERSVLGTYPMTFMSAHYIYLASSMLLAYGLLRLNPRVKFLKRMRDCSDSFEREMQDIEWGIFLDMSSSCLVLLAWCAERWPGIMEILKVYQQLFKHILKELIKKGVFS